MPVCRDQTGREVSYPAKPERIVSIVPSQTELLYALGLEKEVRGITAYCVHPSHWRAEKAIIGGTKDLNIARIRQLEPQLAIGNKEENVKEQVEKLEEAGISVWLSDVSNLDDALEMIRETGILCSREKAAKDLVDRISAERKGIKPLKGIRALCLIWKDPYMAAGKDTFISAMLKEAGLENYIEDDRYPEVRPEDLYDDPPEVILLLSEPYSFSSRDLHYFGKEFPGSLIKIADGEMMSWYGSRLLYSLKYLKQINLELQLVFLK